MHRTYPSQLNGGQAYTLGLQLLMLAKNLICYSMRTPATATM